jgi:hypothetical protein
MSTNINRKKDSILLFLSDYEAIKDMPDDVFGKLMRSIFEFHLRGKEPDDPTLIYAFKLLNGKVLRANLVYQQICDERSRAGKKGNIIRWSQKSQSIAKIADGDGESDLESDKIKIKEIFLFNKGICPVNQEFERFWSHYDKNGWHAGNGVLITNKIACAQTWSPDEKALARKVDDFFIKAWEKTYILLKDKEDSKLMVTDLRGFKKKANNLVIYCSKALFEFLESNISKEVEAAIKTGFGCEYVEYVVPK